MLFLDDSYVFFFWTFMLFRMYVLVNVIKYITYCGRYLIVDNISEYFIHKFYLCIWPVLV